MVIYTEPVDEKSTAMKREKQLKSANGRSWIWEKIATELNEHGFISAG